MHTYIYLDDNFRFLSIQPFRILGNALIICLPSCHSDLPKLASGASNLWWRNYLYNVTQLIKRLIRSAWSLPQVTCPDHDRYLNTLPHYSCHFTWTPSYLTTVTDIEYVWQYTFYRGRGQYLRVLYFRE